MFTSLKDVYELIHQHYEEDSDGYFASYLNYCHQYVSKFNFDIPTKILVLFIKKVGYFTRGFNPAFVIICY